MRRNRFLWDSCFFPLWLLRLKFKMWILKVLKMDRADVFNASNIPHAVQFTARKWRNCATCQEAALCSTWRRSRLMLTSCSMWKMPFISAAINNVSTKPRSWRYVSFCVGFTSVKYNRLLLRNPLANPIESNVTNEFATVKRSSFGIQLKLFADFTLFFFFERIQHRKRRRKGTLSCTEHTLPRWAEHLCDTQYR